MHGYGIYKYKNGDKYIGDWKEDHKHGKGKFFYHYGEFYDGEWQNNKKNGLGSYYYIKGERYEGSWFNNMKWGRGTLYYADFSEFKGNFMKGEKHGQGIFKDAYGNVTKEEWRNGSCQSRKPMEKRSNINFGRFFCEKDYEKVDAMEYDEPLKRSGSQNQKSRMYDVNVTTPVECDTDFKQPKEMLTKEDQEQEEFAENLMINQQFMSLQDMVLQGFRKRSQQNIPLNVEEGPCPDEENNLREGNIDDNRKKPGQSMGLAIERSMIEQFDPEQQIKNIDSVWVKENSYENNSGRNTFNNTHDNNNLYSIYSLENFQENLGSTFNRLVHDIPVAKWETNVVSEFLKKLSLTQYTKNFEDNEITGKSLMKMKEQDFKDIGITKMNDLITQRDAQKKLKKMNFQDNRKYFDIVNEDALQNTKLMSYYSEVNPVMENMECESDSSLTNSDEPGETRRKQKSSSEEKTKKKKQNSYYSQSSRSEKSKKRTKKSKQSNSISVSVSSDWSKHNSEDNAIVKKMSSDDIKVFPNKKVSRQDDKFYKISIDTDKRLNKTRTIMEKMRESGTEITQAKSGKFANIKDIPIKLDAGESGRLDQKNNKNSKVGQRKKKLTGVKSQTSSSSNSESSDSSKDYFDIKNNKNDEKKKSKKDVKNEITKKKKAKKESKANKTPNYSKIAPFKVEYNDLVFGKKVQEGAFGEVYRGVWLGNEIAIKKFKPKKLKGITKLNLDAEVEILNNLRHPNILLYMGVCVHYEEHLMITEFMENGSLFDHLHNEKTCIAPSQVVDIVEDIVLGMRYQHGRKVLHCDLKSSNILVDENWNIKLADFGLSRIRKDRKLERKSRVGTPNWMAPEVIRGEKYTDKSDVYSFGMCLWELVTKKIPYFGYSFPQIAGLVGYNKENNVEVIKDIPEDCHYVFKNIISNCVDFEPTNRPSFEEILDAIKTNKDELKKEAKVINELESFFGPIVIDNRL